MRRYLPLGVTGLLLPAAAMAITAADLYDGTAEPLTSVSFSGTMLTHETELLTPRGIMDEDDMPAIEPAAGPADLFNGDATLQTDDTTPPAVQPE